MCFFWQQRYRPAVRRRAHRRPHAGSRKWFALIFIRDGKLCANLKCDPQKAGFWRSAYQAVTPAWHMNKTHWNTVELNAGIPREDLMEMVADSFNLTAPKTRGHK